jgi:hypothetical protein
LNFLKLGINNTFRSSSLHISRQHLQRRKSLTIIGLFLWNFNRISRHSPVYKNCTYVLTKKGPNTRLATASDTGYQLLAHGRWFSPDTPASSTTNHFHQNKICPFLKQGICIYVDNYFKWYKSILLSFEWGIIMKKLEKSNILMLLHEERNLDCMYSNISLEFISIHIWITPHLVSQ